MTAAKDAVSFRPESPIVTRSRTFFAYTKALYAANDTPLTEQAESRIKKFIWQNAQEGVRPALLPDATFYTRKETTDAD